MMKVRKIIYPIVVTIILALFIVYQAHRSKQAPAKANLLIFPDLLKKAETFDNISLTDSSSSLIFKKNNDSWLVVEKDMYPAQANKINELILNISGLKILDVKTNDPKRHAELDLTTSNALVITIKNTDGQAVLELVIGKREAIKIGSDYLDQIFVRKKNEDQCYLVQGLLPTAVVFKDWVKQPLVLCEKNNIQKLTMLDLSTNSSPYSLSKNKEGELFTLESKAMQPNAGLNMQKVDNLLNFLTQIEFIDVQKVDSNLFNKAQVGITVDLFSGLTFKYTIIKIKDSSYISIEADLNTTDPTLIAQIKAINTTCKGWMFKLDPEIAKLISLQAQYLL